MTHAGVATSTICAKLGLQCVVYMGSEDVQRQSLNVFRMKMLGTTVVPVHSGSKTLKVLESASLALRTSKRTFARFLLLTP